MKHQIKSKTSVLDKVLITFFSLLIVASVVSVAAVYILNTRFLSNKENDSNSGIQLNDQIVTPTEIKEKSVNFLVAGVDYVAGSGRGKLTDVIMVVSFDLEKKNVNVLQIPRDTFIGDLTSSGKINAVYGKNSDGGIDGLATAIYTNFNLTIDHYITIDMDGFKRVVDAIGGVEVDVPKRIDLEGTIIEPGLQTLSGWKAEKFVRERKSYANGDLGRIDMQKIFMKAMIDKIFKMGKRDMLKLIPVAFNDITTDLTIGDMLSYYGKVMEMDKNNINFHTAPVQGGGKYRGNAVVVVDKTSLADLLNEYFRPYSSVVSAEELGIPTL